MADTARGAVEQLEQSRQHAPDACLARALESLEGLASGDAFGECFFTRTAPLTIGPPAVSCRRHPGGLRMTR